VSSGERISLEHYPRAQHSISRLKGIGGIACFAVAGLLSLRAGVPFFDSGLRALLAGVVGYAVAWFCAVQVWRHLVVAQVTRRRTEALQRRRMVEEELAAAHRDGGTETA